MRNYPNKTSDTKLYNCIVGFLIYMSSWNIQLNIVFDGMKPKALVENFEVNYPTSIEGQVNTVYSYNNEGVEDILKAVKVLRESNYKHTYYFAPYEATPQIYYLHDSFCGSSMCAYPDLLLYVWYNFIIDIDVQTNEFEWVKYSKENKLNDCRNLPKMFLNSGYYLKPDEKTKIINTDQIKKRIYAANNRNNDYQLNPNVINDEAVLEVVENPYVLTIEFELETLRNKRHTQEDNFEQLYGKRLSKETYF